MAETHDTPDGASKSPGSAGGKRRVVYDYYKLLGVGRGASGLEIEAAFRRKAEACHPSRRPGDEAAARRFRLLETAYQVLSDPARRAKYDRLIDQRAVQPPAPQARPTARAARPNAKAGRARVVVQAAPDQARRRQRLRRRTRAEQLAIATLKHILWWGLSAGVHGLVLLILANWYLTPRPTRDLFEKIKIYDIVPEPPKPQPLDISTKIDPAPPIPEPSFLPPELDPVIDKDALAEVKRLAKAKIAAVIGPFGNRTAAGRAQAMQGGGATAASESAVNAALAWLADHQLSTGAWRTDRELARWADPGVTGLATLAFLGAGHTHKQGRYRETVRRALAYLKEQQDTEGCIGRKGGMARTGHMYNHGIATLALVEAYAMTKDPLLREPATRAVDFISQAQNATGGWRYYFNSADADSSVGGWMVMALRSARLAGILVPEKTWVGARKFFASVTNREHGWTSYMAGMQPSSAALVAVGLLCNQYLDPEPDDDYVKLASRAILKFEPRWVPLSKRDRMDLENMAIRSPGANDFYFWYYANLALHQRRGDVWEEWHPKVRETLLKAQERGGKDDGSWPPISRWSLRGGRVYSTAMATLTLEVYYRYAPIYRDVVDEVLAAYGYAIDSYNDFVRVAFKDEQAAAKAAKAAIDRINDFLIRTQPTGDDEPDAATQGRRRKAVEMLISIYRVRKDYGRAIAYLEAVPKHFPDEEGDVQRRRLLAHCHLLLSQELAEAGQTDKSRDHEGLALEIFETLLAEKAPGSNPQLELWVAARLFERGKWEAALEIYREHASRLKDTADKKKAAYLYRRIVTCAKELRRFRTASYWLRQLRKIVGPSLEMLREEADLERMRGRYTSARRIYEALLPRLAKLSPEWWQTYHDLLESALLEGRTQYVTKEIGKLQVLHPDMGGPGSRRRMLLLYRRAAQAARS